MTSKLLDANGKWIWGTNPSLIQTPEERAAYQVFQQEQQSAINPILAKLNGGGFGHLPTSEEFQSITTAGTTVNRGVTKSVGQDVVQWIDCTPRNLSDNTIKTTVPVSVDWKRGCRQYLYLTENRNIYLLNPLDQTCCLLVWQRKAAGDATITFMDSFANALYPKIYWMGGVKPTMTATLDVLDMFSLTYIEDLKFYTGMFTQNLKVRTA
jgi:hypothetical protein